MELSASFTRALLSGFGQSYGELMRVATRSTGSRDEARDLVHDTWLRLAEHARDAPHISDISNALMDDGCGLCGYEPQAPRDVTAYLAVMAQHMALDGLRRQQRHARYLDETAAQEHWMPSHSPDVADCVMYRQALQVLQSTLECLPERVRSIFVAHRVHGEKQPDIATRLNVSINTVERDLMQAGDCIEDALHRWRGTSAGAADAVVAKRAGRRRSLAALLSVAGASAGGALGWLQLRDWRDTHVRWQAQWISPRGQQVRHTLPDGSVLSLDALSQAQVQYFALRRVVQLSQGAAFFEVAHDKERPFIVHAAGALVTVLGTRFGVEIAPGQNAQAQASVQVESGRVRVEREADGQVPGFSYELVAGQSLQWEGGEATLRSVSHDALAPWRRGELVFSDTRLEDALARLARYSPQPMQASAQAGRLRLSGRVRIAQAQAWIDALPKALPVRVQKRSYGNAVQVSLRSEPASRDLAQ